MKWVYGIQNKMTIAVLLMVVFATVFVKNFLDEENVADLSTSCSNIYEDRLLPESYIYHLSEIFYKKQQLLDHSREAKDFASYAGNNEQFNEQVDSILQDFKATHLTSEEAAALALLEKEIAAIIKVEGELETENLQEQASFDRTKLQATALLEQASVTLNDLSEIQLTVGKQLTADSQRIKAGSSVLSRFETALLVILAVVINVLVFGEISGRTRVKQRPHLN